MLQASVGTLGTLGLDGSAKGATDRWLRNVRGPLARVGDERMLTVRYEDLRADPAKLRGNSPTSWGSATRRVG